MMIDEKLNSIGVKLSDPVPSVGSFIQVVITGNLAFVSGQLPVEPGSNPIQVKYKGVGIAQLDPHRGIVVSIVAIVLYAGIFLALYNATTQS